MTSSALARTADQGRRTVFVAYAAPQDNNFVLWLSEKLATGGYEIRGPLPTQKRRARFAPHSGDGEAEGAICMPLDH